MRGLLQWSLLAGLVLALHHRDSDGLGVTRSAFYLQGRTDVGKGQTTLQRRAISRSSSAPNLSHDARLHLSKPKVHGLRQSPSPRMSSELKMSDLRTPSQSTPFASIRGSLDDSARGSTQENLHRSASFQRDRSDSSTHAGSTTSTTSSRKTGSSQRTVTQPEGQSVPQTNSKTLADKGGIASQIGKQLLWIQNNPAKAIRMGTSITANAVSGAAAIAAAGHNIPGAACLAIGSATMKIGIDCYDSRDKVQTWHKQKGIDPKDSIEATKRMISAAKKPAIGLWKSVSKPLVSQQSSEKPWPIDDLPVRRRSA